MKITRYFVLTEDESSGIIGFTPLWVPQSSNFTPSDSPRILVHDMLEHRGCDTGKIHEEIMAFARVRLVRAYLQNDYRLDPPRSMGQELASAWAHDAGFDEIKEPPATGDVGYDHEPYLERISDAFCEAAEREYEDDFSEDERLSRDELQHRVHSWLRIGHMDAIRRYRGEHGCADMGVQVFDWAGENARRFSSMATEEEQGTVLALSYDTERYNMTDRLYRVNPETGRLPGWASRRVARWRAN